MNSRPEQAQKVAVIGLGYVGLPLAVAFGRILPTIGFDISPQRIEELRKGVDRNGETPPEELTAPQLSFTSDEAVLPAADIYIVAVPTPVDRAKQPDLSYVLGASRIVGRALKLRSASATRPPAIVVFESTVYPGCTDEQCMPAIQHESGLRPGVDFKMGYSPERLNPGDREHTFERIIKVVGAQDEETLEILANLYGRVVKAGIHRASSIRVAEAAKVIENTQRDLNIALMNELSVLFHRLGIETRDVLKAARTKWNFLPFEPGLVGGHCIPEDPFYLTHKAQEVGYHPEVILAGRRINDQMGLYVAHETIKLMIKAGRTVARARILVLGITFKEDVPDVRNTRVVDIVRELESYGVDVECYDPMLDASVLEALRLAATEDPLEKHAPYDAIVVAVPHHRFRQVPLEKILSLMPPGAAPILVDVRGIYDRHEAEAAGALYWSL